MEGRSDIELDTGADKNKSSSLSLHATESTTRLLSSSIGSPSQGGLLVCIGTDDGIGSV